jgi:NADH:ubiquinone oxidoreductase subunit D/NADH:ubiquinone oxidoreductase subunit C
MSETTTPNPTPATPAGAAAKTARPERAEKKPVLTLATLTPEMVSLQEHFGANVIQPAPFEGVLVADASKLTDVALFLRDELHLEMLSSITGVDYLKEGYLEVVYHAQHITGGAPLCFKARVPRDAGMTQGLPSLTPLYAGAEFQEREIYDLYGVRFHNHPDLRRILLWDGFNGYPMRKDWREPYYEQDTKPFDSRWPAGHHKLAEERVPWHDNVQYPPGFDPTQYVGNPDEGLYNTMLAEAPTASLADIPYAETGMKTDELIVNMGPQHPSTHGVLRMVVKLDGETITDLKLVLGYLHRNHEQIGERNTWLHNIPFTDRLDYLCGMANEMGYVLSVERLMKLKPTERAEYLRVIMVELTRVASHFWSIGFLLNDLGAFYTPALYFITERELILDLFDQVTGSRMMNNYMRFGGVVRDLTPEQITHIRYLVDERLPRAIDEMERLLSDNEILRARTIGVGYLSAQDCIAYSVTGPVLRASGVPYDIRRSDPYSVYDRLDFDIPVLHGGDVYDRYRVRVLEMRQSLRILQQALDQLEQTKPGDIQGGKKAYIHRVPAGETYGRVETPKGELGFYIVSDGGQNAYRYHVRSSSFINLSALKAMTVGQKVADAVVVLGSLDIVLGEVDR